MMSVLSSNLLLPNRFPLKPPNSGPIPALLSWRTGAVAASMPESNNRRHLGWDLNRGIVEKENRFSSIPSVMTIDMARKNLGFGKSPEVALLFLIFVLSTAFGAFVSLVIISLPTMDAFRKLAVSMDKLFNVVSEEVPGTLFSLKLSSLEINDLTSQLSNLRQRISGSQYKKRERMSRPRINENNPIIN